MGLFLYTLLFPGGEEAACRAALARAAEDPEFAIQPEECSWHSYAKGPAVQLNDGAIGFDSAGLLSEALDGPVMGLYIYDDDFWGYDLWREGRQLDQFATVHDYFDQGSPPNRPGNAPVVARCFGVEPGRIGRYLIPWDGATGYAYPSDHAPNGDSWQMADFMGALGFDYDRLCPPEPEAALPRDGNHTAPTFSSEPPPDPAPQYKAKGRPAIDTPELPSALTSQTYALQRALLLGKDYEALARAMEDGKYQDAVSLLAEAVQAASEEAGLYLLRAFCWKQLESSGSRSRKPDMNRDLTRALELEPENVMALRGRSSLTTTSTRYPQQIQDLTRLMELDPENRDLYQTSRAYYHHWLKDDAAARADLRAVLDRGELWTVDLIYLSKELHLPGF